MAQPITVTEQAAWDAVKTHGSYVAAAAATGKSVYAIQNAIHRFRTKSGMSRNPAPPTRNVILQSIDDRLKAIEERQDAHTAMIAGLLDACMALATEVAALTARKPTHRRKADGGVGGKREARGL